jgi:16S rRNA (guanine527-N7)-methyltransferase
MIPPVDRPGPPPAAAAEVFGEALPLAERYVELLAGPGIERGLLGPREVPRLWDRHVLNSALLADLIPQGSTVADLGSGAGLPGIPLALARPDLTVTLVEPLLRRVTFLTEVVDELGRMPGDAAEGLEVVRARAEELRDRRRFDVVTARALAPLTKLLGWAIPLVAPGGALLALKGSSARREIDEAGVELQRRHLEARVLVVEQSAGSVTVIEVRPIG